MKLNIIFILAILLCFISCKRNKNDVFTFFNDTDSSLYLTKDIKLGDSINNISSKGLLDPNASTAYELINKSFFGTTFDEARVWDDDKAILAIYCTYEPKDQNSFNRESIKLIDNLTKKYGEPSKDSVCVKEDEDGNVLTEEHQHMWKLKYQEINLSTSFYSLEPHPYDVVLSLGFNIDSLEAFTRRK